METRYILRQAFEERLREVVAVEDPSEELLAAAARSFDVFAREALRHAGWVCSAKAVATVLGEHMPDYYAGLQGRRISSRRLLMWYAKWALVFTSGEQSVLPADIRPPPMLDGFVEKNVPTILRPLAPPTREAPAGKAAEVWIRTEEGQVFHGWMAKAHTDASE